MSKRILALQLAASMNYLTAWGKDFDKLVKQGRFDFSGQKKRKGLAAAQKRAAKKLKSMRARSPK